MVADAGSRGVGRRRAEILARIRAESSVDVTMLADSLGVAPETVRRDLRVLEDSGLITRSHGRAAAVESGLFETDLSRRQGQYVAQKRRIAAETIRHLAEAETLYIDEGYTPSLVAEMLPTDRPRSVVTSSLPTAALLSGVPVFTVYVTGGRVRGATMGCVERWAVDTVASFVYDVAVIGANGISLERGLTTPDPAVAQVKEAVIANARTVIFVGVHAKFGVASFARFGQVEDLATIVTDRHLTASQAERYAMRGPSVLRV